MFTPASTDHAVTAASFQVILSASMPPSLITRLQASHDQFQTELPALNVGKTVTIEITPQGPVINELPGTAFSFLRPDGTPAWSLRVSGNEIAVDCNRYTRWAAVSEQANALIRRVFELFIAWGHGDLEVAGVALTVRDDFYWHDELEAYDLKRLLMSSDVLVERSFVTGPVWHSHAAWFEDRNAGVSTLVHLNVDGVEVDPSPNNRGAHAQVAITNFQNVRYNQPMQITWHGANFNDTVVSGMENMHIRNKSLLKKLLIPTVASSIGL